MTEPELDPDARADDEPTSDETGDQPAVPLDRSRPERATARPVSAIASGLGFAVIAALMAMQPLAAISFLKLFYEKSPDLIQPALPEGVPIPRSLVWPPRLYGLIAGLGSMTSAAVLGLYIFFSLCFLYGLFRILNPTFRMTTGVDWDRHILAKTYMHSDPLTKAFLIAIAAIVPAFALWQLLAWALGDSGFSLWLRLALSGGAIWFLFSRDGIAGDFESGSYDPPREPGVRRSLLLRGVLAGTAAWLMTRLAPAMDVDGLFQAYRAIGFIGPGAWLQIAAATLGLAAAFGFAAGGIFAALGAPAWFMERRVRAAIVPVIALVAAALIGRVWLPRHFAERYDYSAASHVPAEQRLARICRLNAAPIPVTAYALETDRAIPVRFTGESVTHIAATPENARAIEQYLNAHDNRTALSYPAFTTLHDAALLSWSVDDAMRVYIRNLSGTPDLAYLSHLINRLQGAAFSPTPGVVAAIDRLADDRQFDYTDRRAWVMVGDIYARFGLRQKAEGCYRRAEMPATQVAIRAEERTVAADGRLEGRLLFAGRPVAGARVGFMSERGAMQIGSLTDQETHITSPFWLSWIGASATTDKDGRFTFDKLVYGRYTLLVQLPDGLYNEGAFLSVTNGPGVVAIRPGTPPVDLGTITLETQKPPRPTARL